MVLSSIVEKSGRLMLLGVFLLTTKADVSSHAEKRATTIAMSAVLFVIV